MTIRVFLARVLSTCFRGFALGEVNRQKRIAVMTSLSGPCCVSDSVCLFSLTHSLLNTLHSPPVCCGTFLSSTLPDNTTHRQREREREERWAPGWATSLGGAASCCCLNSQRKEAIGSSSRGEQTNLRDKHDCRLDFVSLGLFFPLLLLGKKKPFTFFFSQVYL